MKKLIVFFFCSLLLFGGPAIVVADDSAFHQVTLTVSDIDDVNVTGGDIELVIDDATLTDNNVATALDWSTNQTGRKITVEASADPFITLEVIATGIGGGEGTSQGLVEVTSLAADFVSGITEISGGCTLDYTATATLSDAPASVAYDVTYTLTAG